MNSAQTRYNETERKCRSISATKIKSLVSSFFFFFFFTFWPKEQTGTMSAQYKVNRSKAKHKSNLTNGEKEYRLR